MSADFDAAVAFTLFYEGGYANDPADPGGETNFGISKRSYPDLDIKNLTREDAVAIYHGDFWDALHIDSLPAPLRGFFFDSAVNQGDGGATKCLQEAVNSISSLRLAVDGSMGPHTLSAAVGADPAALLHAFGVRRAVRYLVSIRVGAGFGESWASRLLEGYVRAKALL